MNRTTTVALVLTGLAAAMLGVFFVLFEPVEEEEETGPRGEALRNRYFAAQSLLTELGVPTRSRYGLGELPGTDHVIVLLTDDNAQRKPLSPRLMPWVEAGGHLVVVPARPRSEFDLFGDLFGLELPDEQPDTGWADLPDSFEEAPARPDTGGAPSGSDKQALDEEDYEDVILEDAGVIIGEVWSGATLRVDVVVPRTGAVRRLRLRRVPLHASWTYGTTLEADASDLHPWTATGIPLDRPVFPVLQRDLGAGRVTVTTDPRIFTNEHLEEADHALFLADVVVAHRGVPAGALFVLSGDAPSIAGLVWRSAWTVVLALAALVLAWAWRASTRFGPLLPRQGRTRRSLLEHVEATGHFLWRQQAEQVLLESARRRLKQRILRRHPELAELEGDALVDAVAEALGVLPETARAAFVGAATDHDPRAFTLAVRAVQKTWSEA